MIAWHGRKSNQASKRQYDNMRKGYPIQKTRAEELHLLANAPLGPCGIEELKKFQAALPDYQIKVLSYDKPHCIIFKGTEDLEKKIFLIKVDDYYHGCNSFPGFLNRSYYCHVCDKAYQSEESHSCVGSNVQCLNCKRRDCPDKLTTTTSQTCEICNMTFKGPSCFIYHRKRPQPKHCSLCERQHKCSKCKKVYVKAELEIKNGQKHFKHKCHYDTCPYCDSHVDMSTHRCYVQPLPADEDLPKTKTMCLDRVGNRTIVCVNEAKGTAVVQKPPPVFVYGDFEAVANEHGIQSPILVCLQEKMKMRAFPTMVRRV